MRILKVYFFAGAAAALALLFFAWGVGYTTAIKSGANGVQTRANIASVVLGTVSGISGTQITLKTHSSDDMRVMTNAATVFERVVEKDSKKLQSEQEAFDALPEALRASCAPPESSSMRAISLADLKAGDSIAVITTGDTTAAAVTAGTIIVK